MRKRIICMALALMLTLSLAVPALAANVNDYSQIATTFNDQKTVDGPDGYARYSLDDGENALLQAVTTYHWNSGQGATPGTMSIYEEYNGERTLLGTFQAVGREGNTYWDLFIYPNIVMKDRHKYTFEDSDRSTWSYNDASGGVGFITLYGVKPYFGSADPIPAPTPAYAVVRSAQNLRVDGKSIACDKYNIDGSNYFKLRDLAALLNGTGSQFDVGWDGSRGVVSITTGSAYTSPNGTELQVGADMSATAQPSSQTILIDGAVRADLSVFNIGGSNFFKLRELGDALGFDVDYDAATNTAIVESRGGTPQPTPTPGTTPLLTTPSVQTPVTGGVTGAADNNRLTYETASAVFGDGSGTAALMGSDRTVDDYDGEIYRLAFEELPREPVTLALEVPDPGEGYDYTLLVGVPAVDEDGTEFTAWCNLNAKWEGGYASAQVDLSHLAEFVENISYDGQAKKAKLRGPKYFNVFQDADRLMYSIEITAQKEVRISDVNFCIHIPADMYVQPDSKYASIRFSRDDALRMIQDMTTLQQSFEYSFTPLRPRANWPMDVYLTEFTEREIAMAGGTAPVASYNLPLLSGYGMAYAIYWNDLGTMRIDRSYLLSGYKKNGGYEDTDAMMYTTLGHELFHCMQRCYYNQLLWVDESSSQFMETYLAIHHLGFDAGRLASWVDSNYKDFAPVQFEVYPYAVTYPKGEDSNYAHMPLFHYMTMYGGGFKAIHRLFMQLNNVDSPMVGVGTKSDFVMQLQDWGGMLQEAMKTGETAPDIADVVRGYFRSLVTKGELYAVQNTPWEIYDGVKDSKGASGKKAIWAKVGETTAIAGTEELKTAYTMTPYCAHFVVLDTAGMPEDTMSLQIKLKTPGISATVYAIEGESYDKVVATELEPESEQGVFIERDSGKRYLLMLVNERNSDGYASVDFALTPLGGTRMTEESAMYVTWKNIPFAELPAASVERKGNTLTVSLPGCTVTDGKKKFTRSGLTLTGTVTETLTDKEYVEYEGLIDGGWSYTLQDFNYTSVDVFTATFTPRPGTDEDDVSEFVLREYTDGRIYLRVSLRCQESYTGGTASGEKNNIDYFYIKNYGETGGSKA